MVVQFNFTGKELRDDKIQEKYSYVEENRS